MKKKKLLIDLSILKHLYCGLGQIALNYGEYFKEFYSSTENYELYFLLPKDKFGAFGNEVKYVSSNFWRKIFPFLIPRTDVWHAIHQCASYKPFGRKTKYILTIHDYNFVYEKSAWKAWRYLKKVQREINRADKIIAVSSFTKSECELYSDLKGKNVEVIYNGVEQLDTNKAERPVFVENDKSFFFTIGKIKEKKNFHVLLLLMKYFPEKELYIAGEKNTKYSNFIERKIKELDLKNVHLTGVVSNEERIWLYKNCEAFLFPSLFEGFGLPVIEAMQFGKPVFSSEETSLKEIGGDCVFFWENFNPESMKQVMDKGLEQFSTNPEFARKNIDYAASFSYKKHIEQYLKIYQTLLK